MGWLEWFNWLVLGYFFLLNGVYILMNFLAFYNIRNYFEINQIGELRRTYRTTFTKPISILVPAYNEELNIIDNIKALLDVEYPQFEIVVINDGSTDKTLEQLRKNFELQRVTQAIKVQLPCQQIKAIYVSRIKPNLIVVDKVNGGKADALNAGLNVSKYPLFCVVDSDSLLDKDALIKVVRPFIEDSTTVAVGGIVRIANGCKIENHQVIEARLPTNPWACFQVVEYLRAFLFGRMGWDACSSLLVISGAFGLFSKKVVIEAGGYLVNTVGEDMELVVRLHRFLREQKRNYRITFVPDPVCWTEVPESQKELNIQRARWQRGLAETLWEHRKMCLNPRYGWIGLFAFPYFLFFELLGTVVESLGFCYFFWSWYSGHVDWVFAGLFLFFAVILGIVLSLSSVVLEELFFCRYKGWRQIIILSLCAVLENFFYRQLHTLWRLRGLIQFISGKQSWGEIKRRGVTRGITIN